MTLSWHLLAFVACAIAASSILGYQGALAMGGRDRGLQAPATVCALVLAVAGLAAGVLRLGRLDHVLNVFGHLSSGISQGYLAVLLLVVVALVDLVALRRAEEEGRLPVWCAVLSVAAALFGVYGVAANLTATGLSALKTGLVAAYLLAGAVACGGLACSAIGAVRQECPSRGGLALAGAAGSVLAGVLAVVCVGVLPGLARHGSPIVSSPFGFVGISPSQAFGVTAASSPATGVFWLLAVALGAVLPLALALVGRRLKGLPALVCSALGAVCVPVGLATTVAVTLFSGSIQALIG